MSKRRKSPSIKTGNLDGLLGEPRQELQTAPNQRESNRKKQQRAVSYRIGLDTRDRINTAAEQHNVEKSSLVRFLLNFALDELELSRITLPIVSDPRPRKLD
jgi:hypothetical protein